MQDTEVPGLIPGPHLMSFVILGKFPDLPTPPPPNLVAVVTAHDATSQYSPYHQLVGPRGPGLDLLTPGQCAVRLGPGERVLEVQQGCMKNAFHTVQSRVLATEMLWFLIPLALIKALTCYQSHLEDDKFYFIDVFCRRNIDPPLSHSILTSDNTPYSSISMASLS